MEKGPLGERLAALYLESRGWTVRGRNVRRWIPRLSPWYPPPHLD